MYLNTEQAQVSNHLALGVRRGAPRPAPAPRLRPTCPRASPLPREPTPPPRAAPVSPHPGLAPPRPRPAPASPRLGSVRLGLGPPRRRAPPRAHLHVPRRLRRRRATATAVPPLHRTWREPPPRPRLGEGGQRPGQPLERLPLTPPRCTCACVANGSVHATASTERPQTKGGGTSLAWRACGRLLNKSGPFFRAPPTLKVICAVRRLPLARRRRGKF